MFITIQAQISVHFFFQSLFDDLLDRTDCDVLHLEGKFVFHVAWQALSIDNLLEAFICLTQSYEHVERHRYTALELTTTLQELEPHQPEQRQRAQRLRTKLARRSTQ